MNEDAASNAHHGRLTESNPSEAKTSMNETSPYILDPQAVDVHAEAEAIRKRGNLVLVELPGQISAWSVTDPSLLRQLLIDPRVSRDPYLHWPAWINGEVPPDWPLAAFVGQKNIANAYGDEHRRLRALITKHFTTRRVSSLRPDIEAIVGKLLDELAEEPLGSVDLRHRFAHPLPVEAICSLVGLDNEARAQIRLFSDTVTDTSSAPGVSARVAQETFTMLAERVAAKRRNPSEDLTSALLAEEDLSGSRLTDDEVVNTLIALLSAGHETTTNLLDHSITGLLTHPDQLEAALKGLIPWEEVVEEVLRWQGPVANMPLRYAVDEIDLGEVKIAAGDAILANFASPGRCPVSHVDPDVFDVTRPDKEHLAFGHGAHHCVGAPLARLEAAVALPALFHRFPDIRLAIDPKDLKPIPSFIVNGHQQLPVYLRAE